MDTGVFKYGLPLGPDADSAAEVWDQIRGGHNYQNSLVEIENTYRRQRREMLREDETCAGLLSRIEEEHRRCAEEKLPEEETDAQTAALRKQLRAAIKIYSQSPATQALTKSLNVAKYASLRAAYGEAKTSWGTRLIIDKSFDQACEMTKFPKDLKFKRWNREGRIAVQLQGGISKGQLQSDRRLQLETLDAHRRARALFKIRIGSKGRDPIWARFKDLVYHRELPEDATIKWCVVKVERIGTRYRWTAHFTLISEYFTPTKPAAAGSTLAINIGWRKRPDAMRVGYCYSDDDVSQDITLPLTFHKRLAYADGLQKIQSDNFNLAIEALAAWKKQATLPEWFADKTSHLSQWKAHAKLVSLYRQWAANRFEGDDPAFEALERWHKQHRHLYGWECDQRKKTVLSRKEHFRAQSYTLLQGVERLIVEDTNIAELIRRSKSGALEKNASHNRQKVAPGVFRETLTSVAKKLGIDVIKIKAKDITQQCHVCGELCEWDHVKHLTHVCEHCGSEWDQDANAARNLLAFWQNPKRRKRAA